jgi:ectoine hydroxylase-related dioxygenase (phytanoyl-CoA dioxygenase family)
MVICKQPEIGGAVPPHQDSTFLFTEKPSAIGFWYALEDCWGGVGGPANGCLSFCRGSHKWCGVEKRFVRRKEGTGTEFIENHGNKFPDDIQQESKEGKSEEEYVLGEVKAGSLVIIHGNVLHKSERNTSQKSRFIYTFHIIEGEEKYDEQNWLQPTAEGFSRFF